MSEMPDDIRKIARSYVGHQHRWIGPDEVVTLLANAILIERLAAEKRGKEEERGRCAKHLDQIAQAMWERCERKRPENPWEVGEGEKEDAVTAWCFDKAAAAIRGS